MVKFFNYPFSCSHEKLPHIGTQMNLGVSSSDVRSSQHTNIRWFYVYEHVLKFIRNFITYSPLSTLLLTYGHLSSSYTISKKEVRLEEMEIDVKCWLVCPKMENPFLSLWVKNSETSSHTTHLVFWTGRGFAVEYVWAVCICTRTFWAHLIFFTKSTFILLLFINKKGQF